MNCPTCGLEQPTGIHHITLDFCQVALVAAQDAVRLMIIEQLKRDAERQINSNRCQALLPYANNLNRQCILNKNHDSAHIPEL